MPEKFLHYLWQHQLIKRDNLKSVQKEDIEIICPGLPNKDAGPDFTNARIKIGRTIWAGNVEIHTDSEDWNKHGHQNDKAYNNVILHVVEKASVQALNNKERSIPTLQIEYDPSLLLKYNRLKSSDNTIACASELQHIEPFILNNWIERLCIERMESKTSTIGAILEQYKGNWEECFYIILARSFGFNTNSLPFEMLARNTPLKLLTRYRNHIFQLEALLFGQAGFLDNTLEGEYPNALLREYSYLKKIHRLKPIEKHLWKFMRLRPSNFPTIRIAQIASLIHKTEHLFSRLMETKEIKSFYELLSAEVSDFWKTHYTFSAESSLRTKRLGKASIEGLLINTIIPFLFIYGKMKLRDDLCDLSLSLLEKIPAEKNSTTREWSKHLGSVDNAAKSQALTELTKNYCTEKKCLYCQIGNSIIQQHT